MQGYADAGEIGAGLLVLIVLGSTGVLLLFWWLARSTRKTFTCPACGEKVVVEQLTAKRCPTCGTALGPGRDG